MDIKELFAKQEEMKRKNLNAKNEKESEITKVLTFFIGDQVYGIEIPMVIEIIGVPHITVVPGIPYYIKGIINVRSKVVPVIDMRSRFGKEEKEYNERTNTIIIEESGVTVGVIVDEVIGVIPVYQKNIANSPDRIGVNDNKFIKYLLEMQDGIKLVLDVAKLIYDGDMFLGEE
ncbi:MAG: purine-binding chemotaxis protein CheW [Ruminiclostridium sp.]|nr:purine-binding chemotaxis protein CheW [Ruminiclostridium sp.]